MSKLGKKPIQIPKDTKVKIESGKLILTGPKGSRELNINDKVFTASVSENNKKSLMVDLKYHNGIPVIKEIKRISKPGRRIYTKAESIPKIQSGLGIAIVSTSMGIMSDNDARQKKIGGEIICKVF